VKEDANLRRLFADTAGAESDTGQVVKNRIKGDSPNLRPRANHRLGRDVRTVCTHPAKARSQQCRTATAEGIKNGISRSRVSAQKRQGDSERERSGARHELLHRM